MEKRCTHERTVDDEREGNVVCTDCGLVLAPIYLNQIVKINKTDNMYYESNNKQQIFTTLLEVPELNTNLKEETNELDTLCNKLQLYSVTKTHVLEKWELIKKWFFDQKLKDRKRKPSFKKGLIVMAIYETLIELDIPRPMSHLCQDAGVEPKYVWYWIRLYHKNKNAVHKELILKPTSMSEYFLKPLNLSYNEIKEINTLVEKNDILTYAPKTLLASCAYMFLRNNNKQSPSVKKIANLLGISVMSVYRCITALKNNAQRKS